MKKRIIALLMALCLVFALAACSSSGDNENENNNANNDNPPVNSNETENNQPDNNEPENTTPTYEPATVRVAYMPNMGSGSTLITAQEMGYFADYGLEVTLTQFQSGPPEIAAMASGDIDISQIGHGAHALCIEGQAEIFAIDCLGVSDVVMVNTEMGINSIEDLRGKTVAVSTGTSSEIILNLALQRAGMTRDDLDLVEMDVQGMVTAMVAGQIAGCATWDPSSTTIAQQMGDKVKTIASNYDFLDVATFPGSFITTEKFNEENHDILVRFGAALLKAQAYRAGNIEDVCKWLATEVEADADTMLATKNSAEWLTPDVIEKGLADGTIEGYYDAQQQVFLDSGRIEEKVDTSEYVLYDVMNECMELYNSTK